jgi:ligand-binding sensor domain-containing protein/signal transduction histidine kinase
LPKPRFYILLLVLIAQCVYGQDAKRYSFAHYSITTSGLASNEVMSVIQDDEGYMWIATTDGLQRFDGVRFITFRTRKNDPSSIPANFVSELMMDKDRNLWVTIGGLYTGIFDRKNFTFHPVAIKPTREAFIYADKFMTTDEMGNIYIILWDTELLKYDKDRNAFLPVDFIHLPEGWKVTGFCQLPGTKKYVIGTNKGIAIYNAQSGLTSYTGHNVEKEEFIEQAGKITLSGNFMVDMKGRLWFDSWETGGSTVCGYDTRNNSFVVRNYNFQPMLNSYHELKGMMEQRNGDLWMKGLNVFAHYIETEKRFQVVYNGYESEQSISYNRVYCLFEDREENIWVATDRDGLYRFSPKEQFFTNIRQVNRATGKLGNGGPMSFMRTHNGDILVGIWEDGFYRYDSNYNSKPVNLPLLEKSNPSVWSMFESKDGHTIWMGAQPGIWRLDQNTQALQFFNPEALKNRTVRQIAEDNFGNLWIGTQSIGLFKWTKEKGKKRFDDGISVFDSIPPGMINHISIDNAGLVWVATPSMGAYVIDPSTNKLLMHFGTKEPAERKLAWDGVASTLQFDDSTIIIGANSITLYNTRQKKIIQTLNLPDIFIGAIMAMERDRQGYLWVSSTGGLYRVNVRSKIFVRFDRTDGIANDRFIISSSYVLPNGQILFGADNQFVAFNPGHVQINDVSPDIRITGFKLANESLRVDSLLKKERIELSPEDNSITIEFSGLSFTSAYIIRYKLEKLDKEWKVADKNYQAIYSYLPPGTYTFLVRSEDAEGIPDKNITRLVIHVNPPFWKTWWFFCLLALVIAAVIFWLDRERIKRLIAMQKVRTEIASNLHDEVNTTLNNINLLSEMARIKADKDIDRSKEFIEQISHKSHSMILAMDDILWSIDPQNDSMEKSLLRMMEFADVLKNLFGAHIEIALDKRVRSLKLDMKTRHDVFLIFKEALRMIAEFACGKETVIHIDLFKNKLSIKLQDATASFDKNTAEIDRSIQEMSAKARTIKADLDVQYDKKGIAVVLLVPVK